LTEAGFQVTEVADSYQGLRSIYESCPDLVIMGQDLPVLNAEELCSRLRQVSHLPIIVLGNRKKGAAETEMLEAGADAYIFRPPDPGELIARVRSLLRRRRGPGSNSPAGDLAGGSKKRSGGRGNGSGDLTSTEFRLLSCLVLNEGRLVSHSQLVSEVWGGKQVSRDCLKFYVRRLRQKLSSTLGSPGCIVSGWGFGYRFCRTI
jgi:two-component system KDP operon response regulator KdpE